MHTSQILILYDLDGQCHVNTVLAAEQTYLLVQDNSECLFTQQAYQDDVRLEFGCSWRHHFLKCSFDGTIPSIACTTPFHDHS